MHSPARKRTAVLILTTALTLAVAGTAGGGVSAEPAAGDTQATLPSPQVALERALAVFAPMRARASYRAAAQKVDSHEATLLLRDLAIQVSKLRGADRRRAEAILARPTDGASEGAAGYDGVPRGKRERKCNLRFCIWWVTQGSERPSLRDRSPRNGRPDYVDKTIANMKVVWNKEIGALNYKRPRLDRSSGSHHGGNPNGRIDIYIANIGHAGIYGYCTTDDRRRSPSTHRQNSAYCVVDNNFTRAEFQSGAYGINALKVTLAHEFFHAIQFAYDFYDHRAVMEGTATWMEDQVFTGVNDNRQYLGTSPLGPDPWAPLDHFATSGTFNGWQYGTWIWYRFLSEQLGAGRTDDPKVVRQIWEKAVGASRHGFQAVTAALAARSGSPTLLEMMTTFGRWNSAPRRFYREGDGRGAGPAYRTPVPAETINLTDGDLIGRDFPMERRSNDYFDFRPISLPAGSELTFSNVDLPTSSGSLSAVVFRTGGIPDAVDVSTGGTVNFGGDVTKVILVVTNASGLGFFGGGDFQFIAEATAP